MLPTCCAKLWLAHRVARLGRRCGARQFIKVEAASRVGLILVSGANVRVRSLDQQPRALNLCNLPTEAKCCAKLGGSCSGLWGRSPRLSCCCSCGLLFQFG